MIFLCLFISYILTVEVCEYPAHIKHKFSGKYPYYKVPDRKHFGCQQDLTISCALRNEMCVLIFDN